jgi:RNA polymerase subunit RPABC4/transcription elongation factor Spt4
MYQYCPKCKKLIEETDVCPYCHTTLQTDSSEPKHKLTRKEIATYALGYLILTFVAFFERDLTNMLDLLIGSIIFGAFVSFSVLWFYFGSRGGTGYPIR